MIVPFDNQLFLTLPFACNCGDQRTLEGSLAFRFEHIHDVLSQDELETIAGAYKKLAGMDIEGLNNRGPIVDV